MPASVRVSAFSTHVSARKSKYDDLWPAHVRLTQPEGVDVRNAMVSTARLTIAKPSRRSGRRVDGGVAEADITLPTKISNCEINTV